MLLHVATALAPGSDSRAAAPATSLASSPYVRGMLGGAAYGLVAAAISHPFDTIKTRMQTQTKTQT